jgi:hypothetical protein
MSTKRKLLIILYAVAMLGLLVGVLWPFETRLSETDIQRIAAVVQEQTAEPILSIRPLPRWRVHVVTGIDPGPLSGGGHDYYLRSLFGGWRIYKSNLWIG